MNLSHFVGLSVALLLSPPAVASSVALKGPAESVDRHEVRRAAIAAAANKVATWQLAHLSDLSYIPKLRSHSEDRRGWVQGTFYVGLLEWARLTGNSAQIDAVERWARSNDFRLGRRTYHADDHIVGRVYIGLAEIGRIDPSHIAPTQAVLDAVLAAPSGATLNFVPSSDPYSEPVCTDERWCWCDALFMAPPTWLALTRATGNPKYWAFANKEFWATKEFLFDQQAALFFRDSRFFDRRDAGGQKLFWARGNGWVVGGIVQILEQMPADDPDRHRYETLLREMASALAKTQKPSGFWGASLLDQSSPSESSSTAFFVYALQRGIAIGVLPAKQYRPVISSGWKALIGAIQPDGRLGYVQQIGDAPDAVSVDHTQLYGTGAFLLAASALYQDTSS